MASFEVVRHQATVAGRVVDAQSGVALAGAAVEITLGPAAFTAWLAAKALAFGSGWAALAERPDRTRTKPDGHFHFLDLPDGQYTLSVRTTGSGTRYGSAQTTATVARDSQGKATSAPVKALLQPTTITGRVSRNGAVVAMARIGIKGTGEYTYSDDTGRYALAGVEAGARTVVASAQGCQPASQTVTLAAAGAVATLDFAMVPA